MHITEHPVVKKATTAKPAGSAGPPGVNNGVLFRTKLLITAVDVDGRHTFAIVNDFLLQDHIPF